MDDVEVIDLTDSPPSSPPPPPPMPSKATRILTFSAFISPNKIRFKFKRSSQPSWPHNPNASSIQALLFPHGTKLKEPWTPKEHEQFLMGLMKYGGGRWTEINQHYVWNKTPKQIESYASRFFKHLLDTCLLHSFSNNSSSSSSATLFITSHDLMTSFASALNSNPMEKEKEKEDVGSPLPPTLMLFSDGGASSSNSAFEMDTSGAATANMVASDKGDVDLELHVGLNS